MRFGVTEDLSATHTVSMDVGLTGGILHRFLPRLLLRRALRVLNRPHLLGFNGMLPLLGFGRRLGAHASRGANMTPHAPLQRLGWATNLHVLAIVDGLEGIGLFLRVLALALHVR